MKTKLLLLLFSVSEIHAMEMPDLASEGLSDEQRQVLKRKFPDVFHEPATKRAKASHKQSQLHNLKETFGLAASVQLREEQREILGMPFDCYTMGPLCGVKELNKIWYSYKALAALLCHDAKSFRHVVFLDDNKGNVDFFSKEVTTIGLNNTAHVALFHLEPPISDESDESSF